MQEFFIFGIAILLLSVVLHEVSHGYVAEILGDPTARLAGRLTLNPLRHLDPFGSILVPLILFTSNAPFLFGWARPVPYNQYNLRAGKWGPGIVALAGPASNLFIALLFSILIRLDILSESVIGIAGVVVLINIVLAFFNLIPVPPLDGSKIIASLLPYRLYMKWAQFEAVASGYGLLFTFIFLFLFIFVFSGMFQTLVSFSFGLFTGIPLEALAP